MSRIHEALKKAEQDRATSRRPEGQEGPAEPGPVHHEGSPPGAVENRVMPAVDGSEERSARLTFEALLARCPRPHWKPDLKTMLFFNAQNHIHGTEEFRTLRSRLYQIRDKRPVRTLLITSALPAEGKTFIAANLAQVIARQYERRALLIDADLRSSQLHVPLGAPLTPGLSDYLRGEADEFSVIQRSPRDNLFFLAAGKAVSNPVELLSNGRLKALLHRLVPVFDWIILDSPPAVPVSDASLLADLCDGVLMVVEAAATPYDLAQKLCREFHDKRLLGVVLNRVDPRQSYSSYYYDTDKKVRGMRPPQSPSSSDPRTEPE